MDMRTENEKKWELMEATTWVPMALAEQRLEEIKALKNLVTQYRSLCGMAMNVMYDTDTELSRIVKAGIEELKNVSIGGK